MTPGRMKGTNGLLSSKNLRHSERSCWALSQPGVGLEDLGKACKLNVVLGGHPSEKVKVVSRERRTDQAEAEKIITFYSTTFLT